MMSNAQVRSLLSDDSYSSQNTYESLLQTYFTVDASYYEGNPPATPEQDITRSYANSKIPYRYKNTDIVVCAHKKPKTKEDFYQLFKNRDLIAGQNILDGETCYVYFLKNAQEQIGIFTIEEVDMETQHMSMENFYYSILGDAARAGHTHAIDHLTNAAMQGDKKAAKQLVLYKFDCKDNIRIYLPKRFQTAQEFQILGLHLKDNPNGLYFRMEKPEEANRLSANLIAIAASLRKLEDETQTKNTETTLTMVAEDKEVEEINFQKNLTVETTEAEKPSSDPTPISIAATTQLEIENSQPNTPLSLPRSTDASPALEIQKTKEEAGIQTRSMQNF